jgi:hypothetical protein
MLGVSFYLPGLLYRDVYEREISSPPSPEVLIAECKRAHDDAIQKTQICWLQAAVDPDVRLSANDFLVVEWSLSFENVRAE